MENEKMTSRVAQTLHTVEVEHKDKTYVVKVGTNYCVGCTDYEVYELGNGEEVDGNSPLWEMLTDEAIETIKKINMEVGK